MSQVVVRQGDCIESIAYEHGLFWETVWYDTHNHELRIKRKNRHVLLPGDIVDVMDRRVEPVTGKTDQRHKFRRKGVPSLFDLVLEKNDEPLSDVPYVLQIEGQTFPGRTSRQGRIKQVIPPNAKTGTLKLGEGKESFEYEILLGRVDPVTETSGVQERLTNLGFDCGESDGEMSERTIEAIKAFQERMALGVTGKADQDTLDGIEAEHLD